MSTVPAASHELGQSEEADVPLDDTDELFEQAIFEARFDDLPTVKAVRELIAARGYGASDPLHILVDVCGKFEAQLTSLSTRQINAAASMQDAVNKFRDNVVSGAKHWEETQAQMATLAERNQALSDQVLVLTETLQSFIPPLNKAGGEVVRAADLIQETSTRTVVIRWAALSLMFLAGFFAALIFH